MSSIDATEYIRDPIHGHVPITEDELQILDLDEMQRLRRVRQMSASSLVYHGATHTRFSHSIGVMHLAGKIAESIGLSNRDVRTVRIAGLLHDIGHGPFSHTSDRVAQKFGKSHEGYSCMLIDDLSEEIPSDVSVEQIKDYVRGDAPINLIAGQIDADRMDYLCRDSARTGLEHGTIDTETVIEFAELYDNQLVFRRRAVHTLNELLTARLYMDTAVNNHHSTRLAETMIERALLEYVKDNSVDTLMSHDDYTLHAELMQMDGDAGELYARVANRSLYSRSFTIRGDTVSVKTVEQLASIDEMSIEQEIAESAEIPPAEVVIAQPDAPTSQRLDITILENGELKPIEEVSRIPQQLSSERAYTARLDVYTTEENKDDVHSAAKDIFYEYTN